MQADTNQRKYLYFPNPTSLTKDGNKVKHFLAIADVYVDLLKVEPPRVIDIEPKFGKGNPEPDIFMVWQRAPFFVEIQRSYYNAKKYEDKFERYEKYFYSDEWKNLSWQPKERKIFPTVWIIGEQKFNWEAPFKVIQTTMVEALK